MPAAYHGASEQRTAVVHTVLRASYTRLAANDHKRGISLVESELFRGFVAVVLDVQADSCDNIELGKLA